MIWFYRDFLNGFVYIVVGILSLIFIMAIIGFILERKNNEEEEKNRIAVLSNDVETAGNPVPPTIENISSSANVINTETIPADSIVSEQSVIPPEVIEKGHNSATNNKIPEILDFDKIESEQSENVSISKENQL